jgi:hypothetical protein
MALDGSKVVCLVCEAEGLSHCAGGCEGKIFWDLVSKQVEGNTARGSQVEEGRDERRSEAILAG